MQAVSATFRALLVAFFWVACSALRSDKFTIRDFENETVEGLNPPSQLGRHVSRFASRTVQPGLRNTKPTNALKGFQFQGKSGGAVNGFARFAKPPSYAFKGFGPNQFGGGGLSRGLGSGFGMTNQFARMPGMQGASKRFASGNAQVLTKNVQTLGFQNLNSLKGNVQQQIVEAVTRASQLPTSEIASSIRSSLFHVWRGAHNDAHVLVTCSEVGIGRAAKDFVGRFKIQNGGKDLYVTILKRSEYAPPFKAHVNPGVGQSDKVLLRSFGQGLQYLRNIFSRDSLVYMRKLVGESVGSGLSESAMAEQIRSAIQQKWGRGWNIVVSKTEMQVSTNLKDMMAKFKVNDIFVTILRQRVWSRPGAAEPTWPEPKD